MTYSDGVWRTSIMLELTMYVAPEVTPAKKKPKTKLSGKISVDIFLAVLISVGKVI